MMTEEEKYKMAYELARKGIDLEKVEELSIEFAKMLKPIVELALKNKKYIDKYQGEIKN